MDEEPERDDEGVVPGDVSLTGDIVLENVCFGYRPDKTVLHDISLHAMPGQKVAFVGSTGAGKHHRYQPAQPLFMIPTAEA